MTQIQQEQILQEFEPDIRDMELDADLIRLGTYFDKIAKRMDPDFRADINRHESTEEEEHQSIQASRDINYLAILDPHNMQIKDNVITLHQVLDIPRYIPILGDGNCYYRSIMVGFILNAVACGGDIRKENFEHLARLIENNLSPNHYNILGCGGSFDDHQRQLNDLARFFREAAGGQYFNFIPDVYKAFAKKDFDKKIMILARSLTAYAFDKEISSDNALGLAPGHNKPNGLMTLENNILFNGDYPGASLESFRNKYILEMYVYAEGPHINMGLLPSLLGCKSSLIIVPTMNDHRVAEPLVSLTTAADETEIVIMLRPEHYDLLERPAQFEKRKKNEQQFAKKMLASNVPTTIQHKMSAYSKLIKQLDTIVVDDSAFNELLEEWKEELELVEKKPLSQFRDFDNYSCKTIIDAKKIIAFESKIWPDDVCATFNVLNSEKRFIPPHSPIRINDALAAFQRSIEKLAAIVVLDPVHQKEIHALARSLQNKVNKFSTNPHIKTFKAFNRDIQKLFVNAEKTFAKEPGIWRNYLMPIVNLILKALINIGKIISIPKRYTPKLFATPTVTQRALERVGIKQEFEQRMMDIKISVPRGLK